MESLDKSSNLSQSQRRRKQMQLDILSLNNRIRLLQNQQIKTLKKVQQTKKKAKELLNNRKQNQEKSQLKHSFQLYQERETRRKKEIVSNIRKTSQDHLLMARSAVYHMKLNQASEVKRKKKAHLQITKRATSEFSQRNFQRIQKAKHRALIGTQRVVNFRLHKIQEARKEYKMKLETALKIKEEKEKEIQDMEAEELELVRKLQNTQAIQQQAYEDLELSMAQ